MSDNGIPIIGNEHQIQTVVRKLHLEPNDFLVVRDQTLMEAIADGALNGFECGHSPMKCNGHRILFAPDGIESVPRAMLEELLRKNPEIPEVL